MKSLIKCWRLKCNIGKSIKMKLAVFFVLACLSVCCVNSVTVNTWGRITNRTLGTKNVTVASSIFTVKNYTLTFPEVSCVEQKCVIYKWLVEINWLKINCLFCFGLSFFVFQYVNYNQIHGITHIDYKSHPTSVRFLKGGIGQLNVTLQILSQRGHGINSTFIFYTL